MVVAESGVARGSGRAVLAVSALRRCGGATTMLWLPAFPVATLVFVYAMVRSTALTLVRGGVEWRGTFYSLRELREHMGPLR